MPQVWMTYAEIASLLGCDQDDAREQAIARALYRKKSHDGLTRVQLDVGLMTMFVARIRQPDEQLDRAIADLSTIHREMAHPRSARQRTASGGFR